MGFGQLLKSKTAWGALFASGAYISTDPKNPQKWVEGLGALVAAIGARQAIAKNGEGK